MIIKITPIGKPRMTQRDKWAKRDCVVRYFNFANALRLIVPKRVIEDANGCWDLIFWMPMPRSWSKKKKALTNGQPHKVRPDGDNIFKGFLDSISQEDACVWKFSVEKRWSHEGKIEIIECKKLPSQNSH